MVDRVEAPDRKELANSPGTPKLGGIWFLLYSPINPTSTTMDREESPNPYVASPIEPAESRFGRVGIVFGVFGLLTGLAPSLYILYGLIAMWWQLATMNDPPASIRPMGLSVAIFMAMGAGLMFCTPISLACSWIANRLGSPAGAELAKSGAALFLLPFAIGVGGMFLMCLFTGVELGS